MDPSLTEAEKEFIAMLAYWRREELYDEDSGKPEDAPWSDEHDLEVRAQQIERCGTIIKKMGGSVLLGITE